MSNHVISCSQEMIHQAFTNQVKVRILLESPAAAVWDLHSGQKFIQAVIPHRHFPVRILVHSPWDHFSWSFEKNIFAYAFECLLESTRTQSFIAHSQNEWGNGTKASGRRAFQLARMFLISIYDDVSRNVPPWFDCYIQTSIRPFIALGPTLRL